MFLKDTDVKLSIHHCSKINVCIIYYVWNINVLFVQKSFYDLQSHFSQD